MLGCNYGNIFVFTQDADLDFKDGVEAIELKVPVENPDPVKT